MTNFVQPGEIMEYNNSGSAISSGDVVVIGNRCGIAMVDIAATTGKGSVSLDGVFQLTKKSGVAFSQGDRLYWDASPGELTKTQADGVYIGTCFAAESSGATSAKVKLEPMPAQAATVAFSAGSNLTALVPATSNIADNTKASIDAALDLKADNADVETLRTEAETRLDAHDTAISAILTALKNAGLMASA